MSLAAMASQKTFRPAAPRLSLSGRLWCHCVADGLSTVSESTVSSAELSELCGLHQVLARELSAFISPLVCVPKRTHRVWPRLSETRFGAELSESLCRKSTLETAFRGFTLVSPPANPQER